MYTKAKIYKITSDSTDKIYIGSTCNTLSKRIGQHKTDYKSFLNNNFHKISSFEIIKLGNAIITLIEDYPCDRKEQLHARERYFIELNKAICVNKNIPNRTHKQYYEDNKDKKANYNKQYNIDNKDKIANYNKQHYIENKEKFTEKHSCECGGKYTTENKTKHLKTKKHIDFINKQTNN